MRIFARVEDGIIAELFPPSDFPADLIPKDGDIRTMFHPDVAWVEVTDVEPLPQPGWAKDGDGFAPLVPVQPSEEQTIATNELARDAMLDAATRAINPLQDAVDLKEATPQEEEALTKWKQYRVGVNRVDLKQVLPKWPPAP